jgi:hypothetical protein
MYTHQFKLSALFPLLFLLFTLIFLPHFSLAQSSAGVGISPAVVDPSRLFEPGDVESFNMEVTNLSDIDQTYFLSKRDIINVREGGVPVFATSDSPKTGYELSEWVSLGIEDVFIPARGTVNVPFTITVPNEVSPGSHFGSIILSVEPPKLRSSGAGIGYEVANIISIRIAGDALDLASIRQFSTSEYIYGSTNVVFNARIENEGNTLVKPAGPLEINNMFGKRVGQLNFNDSQAAVFPGTTREYEITWEDESPGFGRYEALLSVVYGPEGKMSTISSTVTFWILPMNIIFPALATLGVLLLAIFIFVKLYIRRTMALSASGSNRRLVRSRRQNQFPLVLVIVSMLAVSALFFIILLLMFA